MKPITYPAGTLQNVQIKEALDLLSRMTSEEAEQIRKKIPPVTFHKEEKF